MRHLALLSILLLLASPTTALSQHPGADDQAVNVNSRYVVERVSLTGIDDSDVSSSLRADMQKLVGQKFDQDAVNTLAERLRQELRGYAVAVETRRGDRTDHVAVTFALEKTRNAIYLKPAPLVYHSIEGFSAELGFGVETHHNLVSFAWTSNADELVERNEGYRLRYEHQRVGTRMVQLAVQFERFHPSFEAPTQTALLFSPEVPGTYRRRQHFAPSVSLLPVAGVKLSAGLSFQDLDLELPTFRTERAYAWTADAEVTHKAVTDGGLRHSFGGGYSLRRATTWLESDFVYTRHLGAANYTLSRGRHLLGLHGRLGTIEGVAPLFERFVIGTTGLLRGWNKFDVAPLGGSRLAHASLEYRYRPFQVFYDAGSVWDDDQDATVRHSIGIGFVSGDSPVGGWFLSLAFPVRLHDVRPVVMFGIRR